MHRPTVGIIALVLLTIAAVLFFIEPAWQGHEALHGACVRVGIVMGAVWLALPQLHRIPKWLLQGLVVAAALIAWQPRRALIVIPLLLVYLVLRPKSKRGPVVATQRRQPPRKAEPREPVRRPRRDGH